MQDNWSISSTSWYMRSSFSVQFTATYIKPYKDYSPHVMVENMDILNETTVSYNQPLNFSSFQINLLLNISKWRLINAECPQLMFDI
jgi:hypothetical protein